MIQNEKSLFKQKNMIIKNILLAGALLIASTAMTAQETNMDKPSNNMTENLKVAKVPVEKVDRTPVVFKQRENGFTLAGILYRPHMETG